MQIINEKDSNAASLASEFLRNGKVISFATDTIYGIAVDASNQSAVERLYQIKKRSEKKPIAIFLPNLKIAEKIFALDDLAKEIATKFLPGALTLILKTRKESVNFLASNLNKNNDGFIGFRIIDKIFVKRLFEKFNGIMAVSSVNLSGQNPINNPEEIAKNITDIDLLITGEIFSKTASTVAKISNGTITIIRKGPINPT